MLPTVDRGTLLSTQGNIVKRTMSTEQRTVEMYSLEEVRNEMRNVVSGNESFIYDSDSNGCVYVDPENGAPSCLVGHVLYNLGIGITVLNRMDEDDFASIGMIRLPEITREFTEDAISFMSTAQNLQDNGYPWGYALNSAEVKFRI